MPYENTVFLFCLGQGVSPAVSGKSCLVFCSNLVFVFLVVAITAYTDRSGLFTSEAPREPYPEHSTLSAMGADLAAALSLDKTNSKEE